MSAAGGLREALAGLAAPLGIDFASNESADSAYRMARVAAELERRAFSAVDVAGRPGACLVILDAADTPGMLAAEPLRALPRAPWLQILIMSQLGPADGPGVEADAWIEVEPLPEEDAARLLGSWQRTGQFADAAEREAARRLARELGGFTLAVELAAIFLAEFPDAGCAALLDLLAAEGLEGFEGASKRMERGLSIHAERKITATLWPALERLRPDERRTLELASLMPPDAVVWDWVESLVADDYEEVAMAESRWVVGRWTAIRKRLEGMRLLTLDRARSGRMHALVQEAIRVRGGFDEEASRRSLIEYALRRGAALETDWDNREGDWEIEALRRWSLHLMEPDEQKGGALEGRVADLLLKLGRYPEGEPLRRHVLRVLEAWLGPEDEKTVRAVYGLARNLELLGRFDEALLLFQRAFAWYLRVAGEMDPASLACMSGIGGAHQGLGEFFRSRAAIPQDHLSVLGCCIVAHFEGSLFKD